VLTWKTVDPKAIYPLERYHAVSGNHEYRIFYGLKAASQDRPWVLVIREVGMACTRMCTIYHTADEAKKAAEQWEGQGHRKPCMTSGDAEPSGWGDV
jgi:hypothetical protein